VNGYLSGNKALLAWIYDVVGHIEQVNPKGLFWKGNKKE